jgi:hypothetical protein
MFKPRPKQQEVLAYTGGKMGVSAVPGSGKTQTLSYLVAQMVKPAAVWRKDQEVLIVTLVNSAVDNFAARVSSFLGADAIGLPLPGLSCAHAARPGPRHRARAAGAGGPGEDFQIVDDGKASRSQDAVDRLDARPSRRAPRPTYPEMSWRSAARLGAPRAVAGGCQRRSPTALIRRPKICG